MTDIKQKLIKWAEEYNDSSFIVNDPIQFPCSYQGSKRDMEISGFVTSWISFGNRNAILDKANDIDYKIFHRKPYDYIMSREWEQYEHDSRKIYRFFSYDDFYHLCKKLCELYQQHDSMEEIFIGREKRPIKVLNDYLGMVNGVPMNDISACKKLCMFLRWMVRRDGIVDLGIWKSIDPRDLIMPIDTHVHSMALKLGITKRTLVNMKTASEITDYMKTIFPTDPCLGDFALFGYGINNK